MKGVFVTLGLFVLLSTLSAINCKENKLVQDEDLYSTDTGDFGVEFEVQPDEEDSNDLELPTDTGDFDFDSEVQTDEDDSNDLELPTDTGDFDFDSEVQTDEEDSNDLELPTGTQTVESFNGCRCNRRSCECCQKKIYKIFWFVRVKVYACIKMDALPKRNEAYLIFSLNKRHVFTQKVSLNVLPRVCRRMPRMPHLISKSTICLEFKNVRGRYMCAQITGYIKITGKTIHVFARLGCFRLPVVSDLDTEITADTFENYLSAANMEREGESQSEM